MTKTSLVGEREPQGDLRQYTTARGIQQISMPDGLGYKRASLNTATHDK